MTPIKINPWPVLLKSFESDYGFSVAFMLEPSSEREKMRLLQEDRKTYKYYNRAVNSYFDSEQELHERGQIYALASGDQLLFDRIEYHACRVHRLRTTNHRLERYKLIREYGETRDNSYYTIETMRGNLKRKGRFRMCYPCFARYPVNRSNLRYVAVKEGQQHEYAAFFEYAVRMTHNDTLLNIVSNLKEPY